MSLYGKYIKERLGDEIVESEHGFATYRFLNGGKTVYLIDIYVEPEFRDQKIAYSMTKTIEHRAKEKGATEMLGTVQPSAFGSTDSLRAVLAYGFSLSSSSENVIILRKDI